MKKALLALMCLLVMIASSTGIEAQEVTITLSPGWTWISYLGTEPQDFATALGSFTPEVGDVIKSQWGYASYRDNGQWRGSISQFYPGYGYMYKSARIVPVQLTTGTLLPQVAVTTSEPTDITATSAVACGIVTVEEGSHVFLRGVCWGTEPEPTIDGSHTSDEAVAGSQIVTLSELTPSTTYYVRAYAVSDYGLAYGNVTSFTTACDHTYVDLGLPSGTLWATCNVGATTPEGYGDYFAWGETQPKDYYALGTYQYANGTSWDDPQLTKYCNNSSYGYNGFTDNLTTLLPEDDAATANWGDGWRMPTKEEWQELYNNTTVTWITQNGVNGRLFTASNGNSLFLPAAGYRWDGELYYVGYFGYFWSSSLYTDDPYNAWHFSFYSGGYSMDYYNRYGGLSVRAVRSGQN